jgi:hypothetical protein
MTRTSKEELARPLRVLIPLIKDELAEGQAAGLAHYRRAGEMLIEAKSQVSHGEWMQWLEDNFHLSWSTAKVYMRLARHDENGSAAGFSTLSDVGAPRRDRGHRAQWQKSVHEAAQRVDVDRLMEERKSRQHEERLIRQLGLQLIDIGFRVLSTRLHPDKGGSAEAMRRLYHVRKLLKEAL